MNPAKNAKLQIICHEIVYNLVTPETTSTKALADTTLSYRGAT